MQIYTRGPEAKEDFLKVLTRLAKNEKYREHNLQKLTHKHRIEMLCQKNRPKRIEVDFEVGDSFIGYRKYYFRQVGIPWRVGQTDFDEKQTHMLYSSVWMDLIKDMLFRGELSDDTVVPGYYLQLGFVSPHYDLASLNAFDKDSLQLTTSMADLLFKVEEDLCIDDKVIDHLHAKWSQTKIYPDEGEYFCDADDPAETYMKRVEMFIEVTDLL